MKKLYKTFVLLLMLPIAPIYYVIRLFKRKKTRITYNAIVDGFANYAFPSDRVEFLAKTRARICANCPSAVQSRATGAILNDTKTSEIKGLICDACGCALSAKVRSEQSWCPKGKW